MKCPKCGREIKDDKLLCEYCGEEVKYVPLFDTELENQIDETISNLIKSFDKPDHNQTKEEADQEDKNSDENDGFYQRIAMVGLGIVCALIIVWFLITKLFNISFSSSFSYQYEKAMDFEEKGDYEQAIKYLEHALAIDPEQYKARYELGSLYLQTGQYQSGVLALEELLNINITNKDRIYDTLLEAVLEKQDYKKMAKLLDTCDFEEVIEKYIKYSSYKPEFSKPEGVYDENFELEISNRNPDGIIYYTLDGSRPTTNSPVYESPIQIQSGDYIIKAMFVNMYGCDSDIETKTYYVSLSKPNDPEVTLDTGIYTEPQFIEVFHDKTTKIYYSLDGSKPNESSNRYTEPFEMPYGTSNISFIAIDENGLESNIIRRTYQLDVNTTVDKNLVLIILKDNLIVNKIITNENGELEDKPGYNSYQIRTIVSQNDVYYYIIDEYYYNEKNECILTNNCYAINGKDGKAFKAVKIGEGKYRFKEF